MKGWVQGSKILQAGCGWGQSWCEHSIGVCDPQRRIGCKTRLKSKSGSRWMRWSPFLTRRRGRNIAAVPWRSATTVRVANSSRRCLALGVACPLLIVISFNKENAWFQASVAVLMSPSLFWVLIKAFREKTRCPSLQNTNFIKHTYKSFGNRCKEYWSLTDRWQHC